MKLKSFVKKLMRKKSGERFQYAFNHLQNKLHNHFILKKLILILGIIFIIIGIILIFTPGPAFLFLIFGMALLAIISPYTARMLDKLELYYKKKIHK